MSTGGGDHSRKTKETGEGGKGDHACWVAPNPPGEGRFYQLIIVVTVCGRLVVRPASQLIWGEGNGGDKYLYDFGRMKSHSGRDIARSSQWVLVDLFGCVIFFPFFFFFSFFLFLPLVVWVGFSCLYFRVCFCILLSFFFILKLWEIMLCLISDTSD